MMVLNLRPKCANLSCAASFEWLAGGRMFRFHRDSGEPAQESPHADAMNDFHTTGHYWLCERCANVYTLHFEPGWGIRLVPLWPELPPAENLMHLPAR